MNRQLPEIVHIVLAQVTQLRAAGLMPQPAFEKQVKRLVDEELRPRGYSLLVRELATGRTRFLVKDYRGATCDLVECSCHCALDAGSS
jgi:hypothetical protein